jgi:hypothetical protein
LAFSPKEFPDNGMATSAHAVRKRTVQPLRLDVLFALDSMPSFSAPVTSVGYGTGDDGVVRTVDDAIRTEAWIDLGLGEASRKAVINAKRNQDWF